MSGEERHLSNKIRMFEDMLLRSKNVYEIEMLRRELTKMRIELQRLQYAKRSQQGLLFSSQNLHLL